MRKRHLLVALVVAGLFVSALPALAAEEKVVAEGLTMPLGLAVDGHGKVYVTEADGENRLLSIDRRGREKVLVDAATELAGVDISKKGGLVFTQTDYVAVDAFLMRFSHKKTRTIASTQTFEEEKNPDGSQTYGFLDGASQACLDEFAAALGAPDTYTGIVESHPYAVATVGDRYYVADAAGNSLLSVSKRGRIKTLAVFAPVAQVIDQGAADAFGVPSCVGETYYGEPVPTDVEVGRDGHLYVSLLPGAPEIAGTGEIWRVDRRSGSMKRIATGLVSPVDIAVAKNGTIYVAELFADQISKVTRRGNVQPVASISMPGAIEITRNGTLYVTKDVFVPGGGSVVKLKS